MGSPRRGAGFWLTLFPRSSPVGEERAPPAADGLHLGPCAWAIVFWIAQKLLYTTRTRSGPVTASRRRATAGKSVPGGTFGTPYGCWGTVCRVSWGFPHSPRLLRATTSIDNRRIQPLGTCNRGVAVPFWWCPQTRHDGAGTTGHLDHRPARSLSASGKAPVRMATASVPWRRPHPSLRSSFRVSARLGHCVSGQGQPDPNGHAGAA